VYKVIIRSKASKFLEKLPKDDYGRFFEKIDLIALNPYARLPFVKRLGGSPYFRFRFGNYRCIYSVIDYILTIDVIDVGHRKVIYRR